MIYPDDFLNKIVCGDCLDLMKDIPDDSGLTVITDPVWPGCKPNLPGKDIANEIFAEACKHFERFAVRIVIHLGINTDPRLLRHIPSKFHFVQCLWLRWIPPSQRGTLLAEADVGYVYGHSHLPKDGTRLLGSSAISNSRLRRPDDNNKNINHPTPKSLQHVSWIVRRYSRPDDIILDPFAGSGTTLKAALLHNRRFIGIEIDEKFCAEANRRVFAPNQTEAPFYQ